MLCRMREKDPVMICPNCGYRLLPSERLKYSGENDCQCIPILICPECGWKRQRCWGFDYDDSDLPVSYTDP